METAWSTTPLERHILDLEGDVLLKLVRQAGKDEEEGADDSDTSSLSEDNNADSPPPDVASAAQQGPTLDAAKDTVLERPGKKPNMDEYVHLRVSSKHMRLASPVFSVMLRQDAFKEGKALASNGCAEIDLPDDNPDALVVILNIVHGITRKVPRQISLETLKQIAILVNKYQMLEAIEWFSDTWVHSCKKKGLPNTYSQEAIAWLFISWVFRKPKIFKLMTELVVQECDDKLEMEIEDDLPIPGILINTIKERRSDAIHNLVAFIHELITKYTGPNIHCPRTHDDCDILFLGSLIKGSAALNLWPMPQVPYPSVKFKSLANQIRIMPLKDTCNLKSCHGVKGSIEATIRSLEDGMHGLELKDFKKLPGNK